MKFLFTTTILICMCMISYAQVTYQKGDINLNMGIGFPNTTHSAIDISSTLAGVTNDSGSSTPFYNANFSYGVIDNLGLGIYVGYFESNNEIISSATGIGSIIDQLLGTDLGVDQFVGNTKYSVFSVGGRLELHQPIFGDVEKLDTYASTWLGYNFVSDNTSVDVSENDTVDDIANLLLDQTDFPVITYEVNAGARYDVSDQFAIFGEAGFGRFLVNAGFTYHIVQNTSKEKLPDARDF